MTRFGLTGLARGQTASLNVVLPDSAHPPGPCVLTLRFLDARNEPFVARSGDPVRHDVALLPGEAAVLELTAASAFAGTSALRRLFRASVEAAADVPPDLPSPCTGLIATLEIYDNLTGRTQVHVPNPGPPDARVPDPGPPELSR
jgi:hypothetical protein